MVIYLWNNKTAKYIALNTRTIERLNNLFQFPIVSVTHCSIYIDSPINSKAINEVKESYLDWCNETNTEG